jgi:hypothetical protein
VHGPFRSRQQPTRRSRQPRAQPLPTASTSKASPMNRAADAPT